MVAGSLLGTVLLLAWSRVESLWAFYALWVGLGVASATRPTVRRASFFNLRRSASLRLRTWTIGVAPERDPSDFSTSAPSVSISG
jgi:hypothetical protein